MKNTKIKLCCVGDAEDLFIHMYAKKHKVSFEVAKEMLESQGMCERLVLDNVTLNGIFGGGLPLGKIVEFYGKEGIGKSTLAYYLMQQVQRKGGKTALIETENKLSFDYLKIWGLSRESTFIVDINSVEGEYCFEDALEASVDAVNMGCDLVVFDSVNGVPTKREMYGSFLDANIGGRAKALSSGVSRLTNMILKCGNKSTVIFINQARANFHSYMSLGGVQAITTSGGHALRHACSLRLQVSRVSNPSELGKLETRVAIKKTTIGSKVAKVSLRINTYAGEIEEDFETLIDILLCSGAIVKEKLCYTVKGVEGSWVGKPKLQDWLKNNKSLVLDLFKGVKAVSALEKEGDDVLGDFEKEQHTVGRVLPRGG